MQNMMDGKKSPPTRLDSRPGWPASATDGARARSPSSTARDLKLAWKQHRERREEGGRGQDHLSTWQEGEGGLVSQQAPPSLSLVSSGISLSLSLSSECGAGAIMYAFHEGEEGEERKGLLFFLATGD